ncbi:FAD-dependent oxidoreductase [Flavobacterium sp. MAH-1]|uniref:Tryptophan 2-monooxygenase n=1 Tax=Flavobacterium agri TaxID=2743471 RepID=A0A7Y8Y0H7_9FLAO|nr:FAD-dependent oxidoreductase [Flavobacterium agri]NYA69703.1 FAD-dependent oxidoreductase [Flavobacterium agri]
MKTIVIGAGAAGLMAAYELSRKGVDVIVLEAENRIGGRAHTFTPSGFANFIEAGAEFIHGSLPLTLRLMKKAKLEYAEASMNMDAFRNGKFVTAFHSPYWEAFETKAFELKRDCTLSEFFDRHFSDAKYDQLRKEAFEMGQGLDLADPQRLSVFCIRDEWTSTETQYRPVSGYAPLFGFLADEVSRNHGKILLDHKVRHIRWEKGNVEVQTNNGSFSADAVIVTTTLGNLQKRTISFEPAFDDRFFDAVGFGEVIKILMEFEFPFWEKTHPELGFLFTEDEFTFWTQLSLKRPLLTGWIGNDRASEIAKKDDETIVELLLSKLDEAFPKADVRKIVRAKAVFRYTKSEPTNGAYSWTMPESKKAVSQINKGIADTVWFAGEAFERTGDVGTVEAAFGSGRYIARKILKLK